MSDKMYYKAMTWINSIDIVRNDKSRSAFLDRLKKDEDFRVRKIGIKDKAALDKFVKNYNARGRIGKDNIKSAGSYNKKTGERKDQTCRMYLLGSVVKKEKQTFTIEMQNKKTDTFKGGKKKEALIYHKSHDCPADQLPDDICSVRAFHEASLLKIMKRRFLEKFCIYTYVGDVVLCLNPYMGLPEMMQVDSPLRQYKLGKDPSVYASAHFAYWGQVRPEDYPSQRHRNQSCIVSGESGAGKTVACTNIMKYLAHLSNARKSDLGEDVSSKKGDERDVTRLISGVSPFLEMFGNAKTNMNDNSSRFGKFTKIWFDNGKIAGAEIEHYLLEKARICSQGKGERSFHSFYVVVRGATPEETKEFNLKSCDDYPKLKEGGTTLISQEKGADADARRMNDPINEKDPDESGVRVALTQAGVSKEIQHELFRAVSAVLNMSLIKFKKKGDGSQIANKNYARSVAKMLGLDDKFGAMLCIQRLELKVGGRSKNLDKDCNPKKASDNCNALIKDIYDKIFAWLINSVCNNVLDPKSGKEAFVGLLDIFGFEVMPRNSIEQLCINFANEKLQWLFNEHVFDDEKEMYEKEGLDASVIPPHKDTTPCCNLVVGMGKKKQNIFTGILPLLDDKEKQEACDKTDCMFVQELCRLYGKKIKKSGKPFAKAKSSQMKKASIYFYGDIKRDYRFTIRHYAGDIHYDARGFTLKNIDKLPGQLVGMMKKSSNDFLRKLYSPEDDHDSGRKKHKKFDTLASTYMDQLKRLAKTLKKTTPHYVRCVKPNDIKFRPVDGEASFDDWKSYRQLLYAGVMEVVEIKLAGFPFRQDYDTFFSNAKENGYLKLIGIDPDTDPKEGTIELAKRVLPKPSTAKKPGTDETFTKHFWAEGNTLFFAKDNTLEFLTHWHQRQVSRVIQDWWRGCVFDSRLQEFKRAALAISASYRVILTKRRFAKYTVPMIQVQAMVRSMAQHRLYALRKKQRVAGKCMLRAFRNYLVALEWRNAHKEEVHRRATEELLKLTTTVVDATKETLAKIFIEKRLKRKLWSLRKMYRIQAHVRRQLAQDDWDARKARLYTLRKLWRVQKYVRRCVSIGTFRNLQRAYYRRLEAAHVCFGHYMGAKGRTKFLAVQAALRIIQPFARAYVLRRFMEQKRRAAKTLAPFLRRCVYRIRYLRRLHSTIEVQRAIRMVYLRESYYKEIAAARRIQDWWREFFKIELREEWIEKMIDASARADLRAIDRLMRREGRYYWIQDEHLMILLNMRDRGARQSVMHAAVRSGSYDTVRLLLANGALPFWKDSAGETPLHISSRYGDENLGITQLLLTGCPHRVKALNIVSRSGGTVLDALFEENSENLKVTFKSLMWLMNNGAESAKGIDIVAEIKKEVTRRQQAKAQRALQEQRLSTMRDRMLKKDPLLQLTMAHLTRQPDPVTEKQQRKTLDVAAVQIQRIVRGWLVRSIPAIVRWRMRSQARSERRILRSSKRRNGRVNAGDGAGGKVRTSRSISFSSDGAAAPPPGLLSASARSVETLLPLHKGSSAVPASAFGDSSDVERYPEVVRIRSKVKARLEQYREKLRRHRLERESLRRRLYAMQEQFHTMQTKVSEGEVIARKVPQVIYDIGGRDDDATHDGDDSKATSPHRPPGVGDESGDQLGRRTGVPTLWGPSSRNGIIQEIERPLTKRIHDPRSRVELSSLHSSLLAAMQAVDALAAEALATLSSPNAEKRSKERSCPFDWHYIDSASSVHGPFRLGRVMRWYRQRRLRGDDGVRFGVGQNDRFIPLSCVKRIADTIPRSDPVHMEHSYVSHCLEDTIRQLGDAISDIGNSGKQD